ncbi:hypothetical protein D3C73_1049890 [compost metagenome]
MFTTLKCGQLRSRTRSFRCLLRRISSLNIFAGRDSSWYRNYRQRLLSLLSLPLQRSSRDIYPLRIRLYNFRWSNAAELLDHTAWIVPFDSYNRSFGRCLFGLQRQGIGDLG